MSEFIATFYITFFVLYSVGLVTFAIYAAHLNRTLRRIEDEAKEHRLYHENNRRPNESTHKSDPTQPLLGVVQPRDK